MMLFCIRFWVLSSVPYNLNVSWICQKQEEVRNAENAVRMLGGSILQITPGVFSLSQVFSEDT